MHTRATGVAQAIGALAEAWAGQGTEPGKDGRRAGMTELSPHLHTLVLLVSRMNAVR
jgi:hypothetical protein